MQNFIRTKIIRNGDISSPTILVDPNLPNILAVQGELCVRLAHNKEDLKAVQALRYSIFYKTLGAHPKLSQRLTRLDRDHYDDICEHLLLTTRAVVQGAPKKTQLANGETVVGCYRLLRRGIAEQSSGFYSANEFDLAPFLSGIGRGLNILELGRSCVAPAFRSGNGISLMWRGLGVLIKTYEVDAMIGCASFAGTNLEMLAQPLSYLHHFHSAEGMWRVRAHQERYIDMNIQALDEINPKAALRALPPVLRGYLRSGALIGDGAVIDHQFNTTDVFVIMPLSQLSERYRERYVAE